MVPVCPRCESTDIDDQQAVKGQYNVDEDLQVCQHCGFSAPMFPTVERSQAPESPLPEDDWHDIG